MPAGSGFDVDLAAVHDATGRVSRERDGMRDAIAALRTIFRNVEDHWRSPAGNSFATLTTNFNSTTDNLMAVLDDAIKRMRVAYDAYVRNEQANTKNLLAKNHGGGGGSGNGDGSGGTPMTLRSGARDLQAQEPAQPSGGDGSGGGTPLTLRSGAMELQAQEPAQPAK